MSGNERRQAARIEAVLGASVRLADLDDGRVARGRVRDLSDHGACIVMRRHLPVGSLVQVDLECEMPLRVHLGYDMDSLVVDGPMHTHVVRIAGVVSRIVRLPNRHCELGIRFSPQSCRFDELQALQVFVDNIRENDAFAV